MDYEDIIKLEEESPIYSTGNNSHELKNYMASFYDHDSELEPKEPQHHLHSNDHLSIDKAIDYVQNYIDIIDTPLEDIVNCLERLQLVDNLDKILLRKKILKRKNTLKRYRAKNRLPKIICAYEEFTMNIPIIAGETEAEIKKKRNRVSAQVSRDRKKQYFRELEEKNQKLEEQIIRARLENQKLKKQIQDTTSKPKSRVFSDTLNNKLTRLLIFLGIVCLIGMLKETFFTTKDSLAKLQMHQKIDQVGQFASLQHATIIEEGQRKVAEFLEEPELEKQLLEKGERKVSFEVDSDHAAEGKRQRFFSTLIEKLTEMKQQITELKNIEL